MKFNPKVSEWAARLPGFAAYDLFALDGESKGPCQPCCGSSRTSP